MRPLRRAHAAPWEFDAEGLARALIAERQQHGWSTRELARRSGISQSYVVALERSRDAQREPGPTPTIDVIAGLAHALAVDPVKLFRTSIRRSGQHILLVVEDHRVSALDHARAATLSHEHQ